MPKCENCKLNALKYFKKNGYTELCVNCFRNVELKDKIPPTVFAQSAQLTPFVTSEAKSKHDVLSPKGDEPIIQNVQVIKQKKTRRKKSESDEELITII